jgi:carboxypeptidase D
LGIEYRVNGTAIPDVDFDIGEAYAGLLPISKQTEDPNQLYFWYSVSQNRQADDEILIWLNGGPGASSLEGLLQENGPFLWQFGTFKPVPVSNNVFLYIFSRSYILLQNPWTWVNLTNVVWIEQPIGTGFSQGNVSAVSEEDVAQQFLGFWRNFVDTFDLHGRKIFIAGESYAGMYIPYLADAMFNEDDDTYFRLNSTMMYDPLLNDHAVLRDLPALAFTERSKILMPLNDTFMQNVRHTADDCGYTSYMKDHLVFPPNGLMPPPPDNSGKCALWGMIQDAATLVNPVRKRYLLLIPETFL